MLSKEIDTSKSLSVSDLKEVAKDLRITIIRLLWATCLDKKIN